MLDNETKRRIDTARDILVGKLPDPKSQVEQITIALIYKFMDDMDAESVSFGGDPSFFVGEYEKYGWRKLLDNNLGGFEMLALYGEAMTKLHENENLPQLFRDIFKNAYLPYRDPETLKLFLKTINGFTYDHSERLGDAFEYLLSVLGSQGDAGQFRTPRHIIDFIVKVLDPKKTETISDPACGTAGFLISAYKHILQNSPNLTPDERKRLMTNFAGYDISPDMVRLSLVNMYLHGFPSPHIYEYDSLTSEDRWNETFDIVMANPPFMSPKGGIKPHKKFSISANRSEVLFVDFIAEHIHPTHGRAGIIVPEGIIFQSAGAYKDLRKMLVDKAFLYAVVSLPAGVFQPYSGVKTSVLLMDKTLAAKTDKILFVKIQNDGFGLGAQRREMATSDLPDALNLIRDFQQAVLQGDTSRFEGEDLPLQAVAVEKAQIAANSDYNLSGDRYKTNKAREHKFETVELGEVCKIYQPQTITSNEITAEGKYKVFGANGVIGYFDKYNHEESEVLITCRGATCGTINLSEPKSWVTGNAMVVSPLDGKVTKPFLFYLLRNVDLSPTITGAAQPQITRTSLSPFEIPLPPLSIQKEIVEKIEGFQRIIDGAKQVVENYKPQIDISPDWEMVELGEVCGINEHSAVPLDLFGDTDFIYIDISSVENETGKVSFDNVLNTKEAPSRARRLVQKNDILLSTVRPNLKAFGFLSDLPEKTIASTGFAILTAKERIQPKFAYYLMFEDSVLNQMIGNMEKGSYPSINQKDVSELKIPLPPIEVQQEIVARIEREQSLVTCNRELIEIFEAKIKDEINKLWEE